MSEKAFVFLEALEVLESVKVISSFEYVVHQESVEKLIEHNTIVASDEPMLPYLLLAINKPTLILTDKEEFQEVLIPKIIIDYKGEHPLEKLELILNVGELFDKEKKAKEMYTNSRDEYLNLISYVERLDKESLQVHLFSNDEWLISLFNDAQIEVALERVDEESEPLFMVDKEGKNTWYSFSKRVNGYGYSDINSSAILYPQHILNDIISLLYLAADEATLTYIKRVEGKE